MKTLKKNKILLIIAVAVFAVSVMSLIGTLNFKTARAESLVSETFVTEDGVSAKLSAGGGIRFRAKFDVTTKDNILASEGVTLEFVVAPKALFENGTAEEQGLIIPVDKNKIYDGGDGLWYANGCVTDILEANRSLEFKAVARIKNGDVVTDTATNSGDLARGNLYDVINAAVLDSREGFNDFEKTIFALPAYNAWFGTKDYPVQVSSLDEYNALIGKINGGATEFDGKFAKYSELFKNQTGATALDADKTAPKAIYGVTLNLNGATSCEPLSTYIEGAGATLPVPTKTDSAFMGWYEEADCSGNAVTEITALDEGDKTFYARWVRFEKQEYSLNLNGSKQLNLEFTPAAAQETATFASSAASVIEVDGNGKVTARAYGQSVITATVGEHTVNCTVTVSPLVSSAGTNVLYNGSDYSIKITDDGEVVSGFNTGVAASKLYYSEITFSGIKLYNQDLSAFGMAHFATEENFFFDKFHIYAFDLAANSVGYWHRTGVGKNVSDGNLALNMFNTQLNAAYNLIKTALSESKDITLGIARSEDYSYTFVNGRVVMKTALPEALLNVDTYPGVYVQSLKDDGITVKNVTFLSGDSASEKLATVESPLADDRDFVTTYDEAGNYYMHAVNAGEFTEQITINNAAASKQYYAEYVLNGFYITGGQYKAFGLAHQSGDTFMFDKYAMYLGDGSNDPASAGYWHRSGVGLNVADGDLIMSQADDALGASKAWIINAASNRGVKTIKIGVARNGNYVYTFVNDVIVLQAKIADEFKDVDTAPSVYMQAIADYDISISGVTYLGGEDAVNKINAATKMLRYSRVFDVNYKPATIAEDSSSFRFEGSDDSDAAWRASVTQEALFGINATIDMDITVLNTANGHIGINIAKDDGNGWTGRNNFSDGLTLAGYWMWTNGGKQQGVDYFKDGLTTWETEWCGGPADDVKSGNFHVQIKLTANEDGTVKSVLTISNGGVIMQTVERTSVNTHGADEIYRIHFLTHAIDYEVTNLTIA